MNYGLTVNTFYEERKSYTEDSPALYAFWLKDNLNLRSMQVVQSMAGQMTGTSGPDGDVVLLLEEPISRNPLQLLLDGQPSEIETARIREAVNKSGLGAGSLLVMLKCDYAYTKYFSVSVGKRVILDISSLNSLDRIELF